MPTIKNDTLTTEIKPDWGEIDHVRERTETFLKSCGFSDDIIHALQMVSSELVENAVKYGDFSASGNQKITHSVDVRDGRITVEVKNPIKPSDEDHLDRLDSQIQWIRGFQNPFEAYVEKLKEVSAKMLAAGESGLGLVRIAYEGQSILDFYVDDHNILAVSAVLEYK